MMVYSNAQSQASPKRRDKEDSQHESFRDELATTRSVSGSLEYQSLRSSRNDSKGRNVICGSRGYSTGGTVKQLIAETLEELKESESKSEKLRRRLVQLSNLLESIGSHSEEPEQ